MMSQLQHPNTSHKCTPSSLVFSFLMATQGTLPAPYLVGETTKIMAS